MVRADDLEEVLDSVLPALPGGLHISDQGETVGLTMLATTDAPGEEELRRLVGDRLIDLSVSEASDDWRDRRLSRYTPLVVADRFLLRPEWAPPGEDPSLIEIVLGQSPAFGTGMHPTTQACLAVLSESEAGGSFADYGCGSGVLSIAAATLGWSPVDRSRHRREQPRRDEGQCRAQRRRGRCAPGRPDRRAASAGRDDRRQRPLRRPPRPRRAAREGALAPVRLRVRAGSERGCRLGLGGSGAGARRRGARQRVVLLVMR